MALFEYKAVSPNGETLQGTMEAASVDMVVLKLQEGFPLNFLFLAFKKYVIMLIYFPIFIYIYIYTYIYIYIYIYIYTNIYI